MNESGSTFQRLGDDRLAEILEADATLVGCDDHTNHEVGLMAREIAEHRGRLAADLSAKRDAMPETLPIAKMLRDARSISACFEGGTIGDLAVHVVALADELRKATEACAIAYGHIDTYGVGPGGHDRESSSQDAVFDALRPFVRTVGHGSVSAYSEDVQ